MKGERGKKKGGKGKEEREMGSKGKGGKCLCKLYSYWVLVSLYKKLKIITFCTKKYKSLLFRTKKDTNLYFFLQTGRYESLLFRTKKLGIICFRTKKNDS